MYKAIIAISNNRVIGKANKLPWPSEGGDLKFFRETTWGGNLLMGRKTYDGLGTPHLPNRNIFVLTSKNSYGWNYSEFNFPKGKGTTQIFELEQELPKEKDIWICGGKSIYEHFIPQISEFYVTYIKGDYEGDVSIGNFEENFPNKEMLTETENYSIVKYWK